MTDKEQKSNAPSAGGSAVVMVEKTTTQSRHKAFRPTELSDDTPAELHHKRSRAPAVPSVAEEYKDLPQNVEIREQKESKLAMPSEKPRRIPSKKSSKRVKSPEAIAMVPIEVDVQRADIVSPAAQPIPAPVEPAAHITDTKDITDIIDSKDITDNKENIDNDDSITEEIADLRIAESSHKEWGTTNGIPNCVPENQEIDTEDTVPLPRKVVSEINKIDIDTENKKEDPVVRKSEEIPLQRKLASGTVNEGITSTQQLKKKEITWTQSTYLDKLQLQNLNTSSVAWMLDRRASVGPCFRKTLPYGEPSGITICLPKKSVKTFSENIKPSKSGGINIIVSKEPPMSASRLNRDWASWESMYVEYIKSDGPGLSCCRNVATTVVAQGSLRNWRDDYEAKIEEGNCPNFLDNIKGKLDNWRGRIKHVLHM